MLSLPVLAGLILGTLKILGYVHLSWLLIAGITFFPALFYIGMGVIALLAAFGASLFALLRRL